MKTLRLASFLTGLLLILLAVPSFAAIKITQVTGASRYDLEESTPVIFGGTSGPDCSGEVIDTETCNNCDDVAGLNECNTTRIYDNLIMRIYFKSDAIAGKAKLTTSDDVDIPLDNTPTSKNINELHLLEVEWSDLCNGVSSSASCDDQDFAEIVKLVIDNNDSAGSDESLQVSIKVHEPDTTDAGSFDTIEACTAATVETGGICNVEAYPGDAKIKITYLEPSDNFPTSGNVEIRALRFFLSDTAFISTPGDSTVSPTDLEIDLETDGDPETTSRDIEGLENDVLYFLRVATVDQANNVSRFTSDQNILDYCGTLTPATECDYTAKPSEVFGLLSEDLNCFIASVAYGSGLDPRIDVFREFRSKILRESKMGRWLIRWYYQNGPLAAIWVEQNAWTKPLIRAALWPALGFAWLANQTNFITAVTLVFFFLLLLQVSYFSIKRRLRDL